MDKIVEQSRLGNIHHIKNNMMNQMGFKTESFNRPVRMKVPIRTISNFNGDIGFIDEMHGHLKRRHPQTIIILVLKKVPFYCSTRNEYNSLLNDVLEAHKAAGRARELKYMDSVNEVKEGQGICKDCKYNDSEMHRILNAELEQFDKPHSSDSFHNVGGESENPPIKTDSYSLRFGKKIIDVNKKLAWSGAAALALLFVGILASGSSKNKVVSKNILG